MTLLTNQSQVQNVNILMYAIIFLLFFKKIINKEICILKILYFTN